MHCQYLHFYSSGTSVTTGYDWTNLSEEEKDLEVTITVQINVAPHKRVVVQQAVGKCGGNTIYTNYIKVTEQNS